MDLTKIKVVAMDLDGTLTQHKQPLTPQVREALISLGKKYKLLMPLLVRMIQPKNFDRFAILASAILDFDCYDRLNEIKCPVLVLGGEQDRITFGEASVEIANKLNCEIQMYSEYGHAAYEEAKDFNRRVYEFLMK